MSVPQMPSSATSDGIGATILLELGKMAVDVGVIKETMKQVPAHEDRIRQLELQAATDKGGKDVAARWIAGLGIAGSVAGGIAQFIHH